MASSSFASASLQLHGVLTVRRTERMLARTAVCVQHAIASVTDKNAALLSCKSILQPVTASPPLPDNPHLRSSDADPKISGLPSSSSCASREKGEGPTRRCCRPCNRRPLPGCSLLPKLSSRCCTFSCGELLAAMVLQDTAKRGDPQAKYEAVVGIECHIQLNTRTKAFCRCRNEFGAPVNQHVCPVCLAHPVSFLHSELLQWLPCALLVDVHILSAG